ncbi:hypothetical protein I7G86_02935 [Sinorhizobium meliloti]|uniref:hypothetical protein n=1 Tax=Rhizobium meliloti TaxID=382 RepID=UPI0003093DAB|nr:hypothetical protein [Sinorhizobium meliloti]MDE3789599.1 hypothetical protein [Sinorhizobium meliloti]RVN87846.1 hypothetical protein CN101_17590 [Sinorhizobium meliloti]RVO57880.1 hypothetical protein CN094_21200 [Sinorhizobium meliloti]
MDDKQLHILQHSLGLDQYGRGTFYRNHFVTGEGSKDHAFCMALVNAGFMTVRSGNALTGGDDVFRVTDAGKAAVVEHSPSPPKLSRSQQRYQAWLDYDGSMSFIEYLKWKSRQNATEAGRI